MILFRYLTVALMVDDSESGGLNVFGKPSQNVHKHPLSCNCAVQPYFAISFSNLSCVATAFCSILLQSCSATTLFHCLLHLCFADV